MARKNKTMIIRNATIDYLNFSGKPNDYNAEGCRNFCLVLDDLDLVGKMIEDGWNMKPYKPSIDEDTKEASQYYTQINVAYGSEWYPDPEIVYVSDGGRKQNSIPEELIGDADNIYFSKIDLVIRLREYNDKKTGEPRVKGYLQSMYAWIEEDDLKREYDNLRYGDEEVPFYED